MSVKSEHPRSVWFLNYDRKIEGYTAIILSEGETFQHGDSSPDEEGYSYWNESYTYKDGIVYAEIASGGRDCDGEIGNYVELTCPWFQLSDHFNEYTKKFVPNWSEERSEAYDQYAQLAGY